MVKCWNTRSPQIAERKSKTQFDVTFYAGTLASEGDILTRIKNSEIPFVKNDPNKKTSCDKNTTDLSQDDKISKIRKICEI